MTKKKAKHLYRYSDANTHTDNLTLSEAQSFQRKQNGGSITPMGEKTLHERLDTPGTWPFAERSDHVLTLSDSELAVVLASLRFWQSKLGPDRLPAQARAVEDFGDFFRGTNALTARQIDTLAERINTSGKARG